MGIGKRVNEFVLEYLIYLPFFPALIKNINVVIIRKVHTIFAILKYSYLDNR